jgi:hypothetical protein
MTRRDNRTYCAAIRGAIPGIHCDKFFIALSGLLPSQTTGEACSCPSIATLKQVVHLLPSRVLAPHARFYTHEMGITAYSQLLVSC